MLDERMQQKIFWGTRNDVREDWRRLHNEELHDMHFSSEILLIFSRRMGWAGRAARMGDRRVACRVLVERLAERRPLGRGKRRLECYTK